MKAGDVVLDRFMGGGTTGVVALSLGARFKGFDIDTNAYNQTLVRLNEQVLGDKGAGPPDK